MNTTFIFYLIIFLIIWEFILTRILAFLNAKNVSDKIPEELEIIYDEEKYKKSLEYEKEKYRFSIISWTFSFVILLFSVIFWLFWFLDSIVSNISNSEILKSLMFFWVIFAIQTITSLPFSYYSTFVIEQKFWFNKITKKLFFIDLIKSLILWAIIGWLILSIIIFAFLSFKSYFWIVAWLILTWFSIFFMMFYSSLIVPIFNKQTPLEKWELREAIEEFAKKVWFKLDNIFVIDWSKRSSKANAYFSWLWAKKRIVLYDTLINDLSIKELVAVLAHEIWHYKKKHTLQMLLFSVIQTWIIMYIFSVVLNYDVFSESLWASSWSFHVWLVAFWILFTPISIILSLFWNVLSRKNEYEADSFAWENYKWKYLKNALIKLSKNNLSNLTPHPFYEFFYYSHPSVLKRLKALEKLEK